MIELPIFGQSNNVIVWYSWQDYPLVIIFLVMQWPLKFHPWYGLNLPTWSIINMNIKTPSSWPHSPVLGIICPNVDPGFFTNHPATPFHPEQTYETQIWHSETCLGNISPKSLPLKLVLLTSLHRHAVDASELRPPIFIVGLPSLGLSHWMFQLWFAGPLWCTFLRFKESIFLFSD